MFKKSIAMVVIGAMILSSAACSKSDVPEEPAESVAESVEASEEEKEEIVEEEIEEEEQDESEDHIRIEVSWDGTYEDGTAMYMLAELAEPGEEGEDSIADESNEGSLILDLYDLENDYNFQVMINDEPDFSDQIAGSNLKADVYLPGAEAPVSYSLAEDGSDILKSYTGVYMWCPFGISEGEITDYDATWIEEEAYTETEITEGYAIGTLLGEVEDGMDPYIQEVVYEDGFLKITGSFKGADTEEGLFSDDTVKYQFGSYKFLVDDEAAFYAVGGTADDMQITLDEFVELAQYYNGLGMIIEVRDGVIAGGKITS